MVKWQQYINKLNFKKINMDNAKLIAMLSGAKKVMDKVESGDYTTGNVSENSINIDTSNYLPSTAGSQVQYQPQQQHYQQSNAHTGVGASASKLPKQIQQLMSDFPIPQADYSSIGQSFSASDVAPLLRENRAPSPIVEKYETIKHFANDSDKVMISKIELKAIINEALLDFMTKFSKNLSEDTIKNTINTLIKEGKIGVTKKN